MEGLYLHADLQDPETLWGRANHEDPAYQRKHNSQKMLKHPSKQNKIEKKKNQNNFFFSFVDPAECLSFIVRNDVTLKNCPLKSEMLPVLREKWLEADSFSNNKLWRSHILQIHLTSVF